MCDLEWELERRDRCCVLQDLNQRWAALQQVTQDRAQTLGSAHEVQRYHRDADETKDWMEEKELAASLDDYGHDLATVQRLQRKHEGLERDLAALGDKVDGDFSTLLILCAHHFALVCTFFDACCGFFSQVKELDETGNRLMQTHPWPGTVNIWTSERNQWTLEQANRDGWPKEGQTAGLVWLPAISEWFQVSGMWVESSANVHWTDAG